MRVLTGIVSTSRVNPFSENGLEMVVFTPVLALMGKCSRYMKTISPTTCHLREVWPEAVSNVVMELTSALNDRLASVMYVKWFSYRTRSHHISPACFTWLNFDYGRLIAKRKIVYVLAACKVAIWLHPV